MISTFLAARVIFTIIYQKYPITCAYNYKIHNILLPVFCERDVYINLQLQFSLQLTVDLIS